MNKIVLENQGKIVKLWWQEVISVIKNNKE